MDNILGVLCIDLIGALCVDFNTYRAFYEMSLWGNLV